MAGPPCEGLKLPAYTADTASTGAIRLTSHSDGFGVRHIHCAAAIASEFATDIAPSVRQRQRPRAGLPTPRIASDETVL
jgi:hypothetical protein